MLITYLKLYARFQFFPQLKREYDLRKNMRVQFGWGWDHEKNAPEVADELWDTYTKVRRHSYTM